MSRFLSLSFMVVLFLVVQSCADTASSHTSTQTTFAPDPIFTPISLPPAFNGYWYQGKAEICSYDVVQERYGETRNAEQVNVYVTEDFSASKHVKLDDPSTAGPDRIPVFKLNIVRKFETGIYDYSLMQSIFAPVSGMSTLKTTTTVQDWCGHVFMQTNLVPGGYRTRLFSYFEQEGDQDSTLPAALLEDELWTRVRLAPASIKTGKIKVIPSGIYSRLRHQAQSVQDADIQVERGDQMSTLTLHYQSIERALRIQYETNFPHKITGWEETVAGKIESKGALKATRMSAYWSEHDNVHAPLRDSLKIAPR